ncbi:acyl carrier protein [Microbacter margulisiae]|uniref:Acyl carrier protein n=1 Tax=Microbacter margulisiae TaxID=1350067 RepID=A0A7W5DN87_9PORP|nr:acyl carrier protein [Microbacter margulisiae]MBB3185966.1 acyl carrier protein [Microbacter margulisiae]
MENKFLTDLKEVFEIEDREIFMDDQFREYPEWGSLAYLSVIAMLDEIYDFQIEEADFKKLRTVRDLYNAATQQ